MSVKSAAVLAAVAACVFVAGCTSDVSGTPSSNEDDVAQNREPLTSELAFEHISAVDPCSLTDAAAYDDFGEAELPGTPAMDDCTVVVSTEAGGTSVRLGPLQPVDLLAADRREVADLSRDVTIMQASTSSGSVCTMALVFADDVALVSAAQADVPDTVSGTTLCAMAESAARRAFDLVDDGKAGYWEPSESSLARVSACELLDAEQVAGQLGITSDVVTSYPALHQCRWGRTGGDTATAKVDFPVGATRSDVGVAESAAGEVIAGRETWVSNTEAGEIMVCDAITEQGEFGLGEGLREYAAVRVVVPVTAGKDPCAIVRTLAASAWANLPPV